MRAAAKPNRTKERMKTSIFLAVLLAGAAVATSKAEGAFAINLETGGRSASSSHPSGQYREPVVDNRYEAHEALHGQLDAERSVLDYQVSAQHEAWHQEWDRQHKALHFQLLRRTLPIVDANSANHGCA